MSKKSKKYFFRRIIIISIILLALFALIDKFILTKKFVRYSEPVLMCGEKITDLKNVIIIDQLENIYLSLDDIGVLYNEESEYDEESKSLNIKYGSHEITLYLDSNDILVDGTEESISGRMQFSSGKLYLPFSDMKDIYNFEYNYSSKTNIVILDNISEKKETAVAKKNSYVKDGRKFLSKKITKISKDEKITIIEKYGNCYKIRTKDGIIGYVNSKRVIE